MKNYTKERQELKKLGWKRCDRAGGKNISLEMWTPPYEIGFSPIPVSFQTACKRAGIKIFE